MQNNSIFFKIENEITRKLILSLLTIYILQIFSFGLIEFFYPISVTTSYQYQLYIINFFIWLIFTLIILILPSSRFSINKLTKNLFKIFYTNKNLKILNILTFIGLVIFIISKSLLYYDLLDFKGEKISCLIINIRDIWTSQNFNSYTFKLIYSFISPIGTILINNSFLLIFFLFEDLSKYKRSQISFLFFNLIFSIAIYFFFTQSKNIIYNFLAFSLTVYFIHIILFNSFQHKKIFIIFLISIFPIFFNFFNKQICFTSKINSFNLINNTNNIYAFRNDIYGYPEFPKSSEFIFLKDCKNIYLNRVYETSTPFLPCARIKHSEIKIINDIYDKKLNNPKFLILSTTEQYLLNAKQQGDYFYELINAKQKDREKSNLIISKVLRNILMLNQFKEKYNFNYAEWQGEVSFYHLLWLDYGNFGLFYLLVLLIMPIYFLLRWKKIENLIIIFFLKYIIILIVILFIQSFNWFFIEVVNTKFIFFNLFIFGLFNLFSLKFKNG